MERSNTGTGWSAAGGRPAPLTGRRVLVAEDEALVALDLEMTLQEAGAVVLGPFLRLPAALQGARRAAFDVAVLDVTLGRDRSYPLADLVAGRGAAVVFHSGFGGQRELRLRYPEARYCPKPCTPATLILTIAEATGAAWPRAARSSGEL